MTKRRITTALVAYMLLTCAVLIAQQEKKPLTNADIVSLIKAELPESTIILAIQQSPASFNTSAPALIELKNQGASPKILDAMLEAQAKKPPAIEAFPNNTEMIPQGVTLVIGTERTQMKRSEAELRVSSGGVGGFFNPLAKVRSKDALNGKQSQLRLTNSSPIFELSLPRDVYPTDHIALVKFAVKSDRREIETGSVGAFTGSKDGFSKKDVIPIGIEEVESQNVAGSHYKLYRVKVVSRLPPGEYALVAEGSYYDFGIDKGKQQ